MGTRQASFGQLWLHEGEGWDGPSLLGVTIMPLRRWWNESLLGMVGMPLGLPGRTWLRSVRAQWWPCRCMFVEGVNVHGFHAHVLQWPVHVSRYRVADGSVQRRTCWQSQGI